MIRTILASVTHNSHYLTKYITFINRCQEKNSNYTGYTEKHHICPKARDMFPEFASFSEFPWNCANLTPRQHYIAHLLLYKVYPDVASQASTLYFMTNVHKNKIDSKLYDKIKIEVLKNKKDKVTVKDVNGNNFQVHITDPRYLSGEFIPASKGLVSVKDINGNNLKVSINDSRYLSGELVHNLKGRLTVCDSKGNTSSVTVTDVRYLQGELESVNKGKITVKDANGNTFQVSDKDSRFLSGELVSIHKGKVTVRDSSGNTMQVDSTDTRFLSGELVGVTKGKIAKNRGLSVEQVKEIRRAAQNPKSIITYEYIYTVVKASQQDKINSLSIEELKYKNGNTLSYKSLVVRYYTKLFRVQRNIILDIVDGKSYKEIII